MRGVHGDLDPSRRDDHARSDPEELQAQRAGGGAGQRGAGECAAQRGHEDGREGGEEEPELVGAEAGGGGAVGEQVEVLLLDGVFGVAPGAVRALVGDPRGEGPRERGDDEAGVGLAGEVFGLGDDAARARPSCFGWSGRTPRGCGPGGRDRAIRPGRRGVPARFSG